MRAGAEPGRPTAKTPPPTLEQGPIQRRAAVALADHFTTKSPVRSVCSVGRLLAIMPDDDITALRQMLTSRRADGQYAMSATQIYAALTAEGYTVGRGTIGNHRRGDCSCEAVA